MLEPAADPCLGDEGSLFVEEQRFSLVPEWVIDAEVSDAAFRLYSLLLRYGGTSGARMPSRPTLARRMRRSVDAVDRAMRELVAAGMVRVEHRRSGQQYLSNRYHVRTSAPMPRETPGASSGRGGRTSAATSTEPDGGSRTSAATPGRGSAATPRRTSAATVAAEVRPDPEALTESTPPPSPSPSPPGRRPGTAEEEASRDVLIDCGVEDLAALAGRCAAARAALGQSSTRWSAPCIAAALHLAVRSRSWPAALAVPALLAVAADPATRSPMRLAEAGPWWDQPIALTDTAEEGDLQTFEKRLDDLGGQRPTLQAQARAELSAEGLPLTRSTVVRRACAILDRTAGGR